MADLALIAPLRLDALVINKGVQCRDPFRWWPFNYSNLEDYLSPEPEAFDTGTSQRDPGIYLHWTLPRALRRGVQDRSTGVVDYPLVPNRWLIVRVAVEGTARSAVAWVLESDCPYGQKTADYDAARTSQYLVDSGIVRSWKDSDDPYRSSVWLDPCSSDPLVANLGIPFPLTESSGWQERVGESPMFLTAVAPGNTAFSLYVPHHLGVFAFYDDLEDIDDATLSYYVFGWYSDPSRDVLASWKSDVSTDDPYAACLQELGWTPSDSAKHARASRSLYEGMAFKIPWTRSGNPPAGDPLEQLRDSGKLNVAIGNTAIDALTALIKQAPQGDGTELSDAELLRAFQYGLLDVINEVNGHALLDRAVHRAGFASKPGGYRWVIEAAAGPGKPDTTAGEPDWLETLNRAQADLDRKLRELTQRQWRLNADWWKHKRLPKLRILPDRIDKGELTCRLEQDLDPSNADGSTGHVLKLFDEIAPLLRSVPRPTSRGPANAQTSFLEGIANFARSRKLGDEYALKPAASPKFWSSGDPVILISGVDPPPGFDPDESLTVRSPSDLIAGFTAGTAEASIETCEQVVPAIPCLGNMPGEIRPLIVECAFLDPLNADAIADALGAAKETIRAVMERHAQPDYHGLLPGLGLDAWRPSWTPMYAEWRVCYSHVPYEGNWWFDGTDYRLAGTTGHEEPQNPAIGGISLLGTHAQFVFVTRLKEAAAEYATDPDQKGIADRLNALAERLRGWKLLAQEMVGFNEILSLRNHRGFRRPTAGDTVDVNGQTVPLASLIGYPDAISVERFALPDTHRGLIESIPFVHSGHADAFRGIRHGQFYVADLHLYDPFGREMILIERGSEVGVRKPENFPLICDDALLPDVKVDKNIKAPVQLPPRLPQHARLDFRWVDGRDDAKEPGIDTGTNPICGWILPNHLDHSLSLYAPEGRPVGEYRLVESEDGARIAEWSPPPHSDVSTLDDVGRIAPRLRQMLEAEPLHHESGFVAFLGAIDSALWTVDPLGNRDDRNPTVLIGRPLALVRARLRFELDGPAFQDPNWRSSVTPPGDPEFISYRLAIRLGDQATRDDGLLGYYIGEDYGTFHSVATSGETSGQDYVRPIGPLGRQGGNYLHAAFDDEDPIYATLLVDPRAAVHAITGILPAKKIEIPSSYVDTALTDLEVGFRIGPLVTPVRPAVDDGSGGKITAAIPAEQGGSWSWWEFDAVSGEWGSREICPTSSEARLDDSPRTAREGHLQFEKEARIEGEQVVGRTEEQAT